MVLVYYGDNGNLKPAFDKAFASLGILKKDLGVEDRNTSMDDLLKAPMHEVTDFGTGPVFMFLDGHGAKDLQAIGEALAAEGIHVSHKAMKTENNGSWPLGMLMDEVDQEDRWFKARSRLYQLLVTPDKDRLESDPAYMRLMASAYDLYERQDASLEELESAVRNIEQVCDNK